jgi:hypothetical protein
MLRQFLKPEVQSSPDERRDGDGYPYLIEFEGEDLVSGLANLNKVRQGARIGWCLESAMFLYIIGRQKFTMPESGAPAGVDPRNFRIRLSLCLLQ